ncbi:hypothetical protein GCM10009801_73270 [Streptomyces albiaxialis]|uniref:Integral membrane protein n=1 Tax=Streptomyces albiaxialis TaxID=329523 RepID=A0ABP5IL29_9ACTN
MRWREDSGGRMTPGTAGALAVVGLGIGVASGVLGAWPGWVRVAGALGAVFAVLALRSGTGTDRPRAEEWPVSSVRRRAAGGTDTGPKPLSHER